MKYLSLIIISPLITSRAFLIMCAQNKFPTHIICTMLFINQYQQEELVEYKDKNGDMNVPNTGAYKQLHAWIRTQKQRKFYNYQIHP